MAGKRYGRAGALLDCPDMKNETAAGFGTASFETTGFRTNIVALARAVCATPVGLLNVVSVGWTGAEGIDPGDLERIVSLARNAPGPSGYFEASWGSKYCAGVALAEALGVLCVLDDRSRAPLTDAQRDLLRALGNQVV